MGRMIRLLVGTLLLLSFIPPLSLGVINLFVLLPVAAGCVLLALPLLVRLFRAVFGNWYRIFSRVVRIGVCIFGAVALVELCAIITAAFPQKAPENAAVIVLGAKVEGTKPSLILMGRIRAAGQYLQKHPSAFCVASGGKGIDEEISEALCIRDELIRSYHVPPGHILMDAASLDTAQNMRNSAALLRASGSSEHVLIATDGFHMFRAKLLAARRGLHPYALPARTVPALVPELTLRELIGMPKALLLNR